jgi:hypothetical protein
MRNATTRLRTSQMFEMKVSKVSVSMKGMDDDPVFLDFALVLDADLRVDNLDSEDKDEDIDGSCKIGVVVSFHVSAQINVPVWNCGN